MRTAILLLALAACHPYTWSGMDRSLVRCGGSDQSGTLVRCAGIRMEYVCVRQYRGRHWECFPLRDESEPCNAR
jgi:hypothetical protein